MLDITLSARFPRNPAAALRAPGEIPPEVPLTSAAHNLIQTICLCAAVRQTFAFSFFFGGGGCYTLFLTGCSLPPLLLIRECDSVSPPLSSPLTASIRPFPHITVPLWLRPIVSFLRGPLFLAGRVQAPAAHTARPEAGRSRRGAAQRQRQGKDRLHAMARVVTWRVNFN